MQLPSSLYYEAQKLPQDVKISVENAYASRAKSLFVAYIAWLIFGWHYLYLKRTGLQIAFWASFFTIIIGPCWWVIDAFRIPGMVRKLNEDTARELMVQYKALNS